MKDSEKVKYSVSIMDALSVLKDPADSIYIKGEFLGYFINRVSKRFLGDPEYVNSSFNSAFFNESKKKTLTNAADTIAAMLNRSDPISSAEEYDYVLKAVLTGFLGLADGFSGMLKNTGPVYYVHGILHKVLESINTVNTGSQKDMTMAFRRHLVIRGVLYGVFNVVSLHPMDIWKNGKLDLPPVTTEIAKV